jgi:polyferredoxin
MIMPKERLFLDKATKQLIKEAIKKHGMQTVIKAVRNCSDKRKVCTACGRERPVGFFYSRKKKLKAGYSKVYYNSECIDCMKKPTEEDHNF